MPSRAAAPSRSKRSHAASTAGTTTAPLCTGPPSNVSSKSSPCAAVPLSSAASSARNVSGWPIAVHGPPRVERALHRPDVVGVPRRDAEAGDVEHEAVDLLAHGVGQRLGAHSGDTGGERSATDSRADVAVSPIARIRSSGQRTSFTPDSCSSVRKLARRVVERLREVRAGPEAVLELVVVEILAPRRRCASAAAKKSCQYAATSGAIAGGATAPRICGTSGTSKPASFSVGHVGECRQAACRRLARARASCPRGCSRRLPAARRSSC